MKKLLTAISLILAAVILASCALSENDSLSADTKPEEGATYGYTNETASPSSYSEYRTAATDFSLEMLRNAYDGKDTVIPTAGLYSSLSLLNNIASGTTQLELKTLLGKKASATAINEGNGYFVSRLEAIKTKKASVKLDNNIFFEENTPVSGSVLRTNVSYYNHGLFKLNFSDSSGSAALTRAAQICSRARNICSRAKAARASSRISRARRASLWLCSPTRMFPTCSKL